MTADGALAGSRLTDAISAAMVELYAQFYNHTRTTATTYINDNIVVCVLENILSADETAKIGDGNSSDVIDGRVAFQEGAEDEFTAAIERLTHRSVTAFLSRQSDFAGYRLRAVLSRGAAGRGGMSVSAASRIASATDEALMREVQADDPAAFGELYDRHAARAWRLARSICGDAGRSEDAVQEAFLSAWRSRAGYDSEAGLVRSWLMTFVGNRAIDSFRREASGQRPPLADADSMGPDPAGGSLQDDVIARTEADALRASLQHLPDAQAEVIALAYFGELSHSEIAARLCLPAGTVKGRMRLGLKKLREQIESTG